MNKPLKYAQELPADVEKALDTYLERVKAIKWFKPEKLERTKVDSAISASLKAFGVEATIEYRRLSTTEDWDAAWGAAWGAARDAARDAAWDAAWGAAWDAARGAARVAAWGAAWDAARDAAWDAARGAARDAAWGAADLLAALTPDGKYKKQYPDGNFLKLVDLWEMGLYPVGVVRGKFLCYVPDVEEASALFDEAKKEAK
jgi:hypothetical protein